MTMDVRGAFSVLLIALATVAFPGAASAQQQKMNICSDSKDHDARIRACTDLIKRGGKEAENYYFNRSMAHFNKGECDPAFADAEKALSLKRDGYNHGQLGMLLLECKNDFEGAIANLSMALRMLPNDAFYRYSRGKAYAANADFERALQDYNEAIRLKPREADYYFRRANVWL